MMSKTNLGLKRRKALEAKMAAAFSDQMSSLPEGYREILLDDLVTAFESRFDILSRVQVKGPLCIQVVESEVVGVSQ